MNPLNMGHMLTPGLESISVKMDLIYLSGYNINMGSLMADISNMNLEREICSTAREADEQNEMRKLVSGYPWLGNLDHPGTYLLLSSIRHMSITF